MDGWVVGTGQEQPGERAGSQAGKRSAEGAPEMLELANSVCWSGGGACSMCVGKPAWGDVRGLPVGGAWRAACGARHEVCGRCMACKVRGVPVSCPMQYIGPMA